MKISKMKKKTISCEVLKIKLESNLNINSNTKLFLGNIINWIMSKEFEIDLISEIQFRTGLETDSATTETDR